MSSNLDLTKNWRCRLGRHHYRRVQDDNPENLKSAHLECTRCLKLKEIKEYEKPNVWIGLGGGSPGSY